MGSNRPNRQPSGGLPALRVLHRRVRSRKHERLMPVVAAHEIRGRPVPSPNLDDLRRLVGRTYNPAVHMQPVTNYRAHDNSSRRFYPAAYPPVRRRGTSFPGGRPWTCLLYTSDAADDLT